MNAGHHTYANICMFPFVFRDITDLSKFILHCTDQWSKHGEQITGGCSGSAEKYTAWWHRAVGCQSSGIEAICS